MQAVARQTGGALGVAVLGSIFASHYHRAVGGAGATLAGLPAGARAAARDSIGKALETARTLPAAPARAVTAMARHSFVVSMRLAYGIAAGVVLTAAFIAWRFLPARAPADPLPDEGLTPAELVAGDS